MATATAPDLMEQFRNVEVDATIVAARLHGVRMHAASILSRLESYLPNVPRHEGEPYIRQLLPAIVQAEAALKDLDQRVKADYMTARSR